MEARTGGMRIPPLGSTGSAGTQSTLPALAAAVASIVAALAVALAWSRLPSAGAVAVSVAAAGSYSAIAALALRRDRRALVAISVGIAVVGAAAVLAIGLGGVPPASGHPGGAGTSRTWVSGTGDDAYPCSRTAPCKTFGGAISKTAAGGEINVLDPGAYGTVTITKPISIVAAGQEAGVLAAGTNGIVVNAGPTDVVVIRGLDIEGFGTGINGIRFIAGGTLHVEHTTINNFAQKGIDFEPSGSSQLIVSDSEIRHNDVNANGGGVLVQPSGTGTADATLDGVRLNQNLYGVKAGARSDVTVSDSVASSNVRDGVIAVSSGQDANLNVERSTLANNAMAGARANGAAASLRLSDNFIVGNDQGLVSESSGIVLSFGNNSVADNNTNGNPTATVTQR